MAQGHGAHSAGWIHLPWRGPNNSGPQRIAGRQHHTVATRHRRMGTRRARTACRLWTTPHGSTPRGALRSTRATEGKQARKEARAKKKADKAEELSRQRAAYEACKAKCVCGKAPCPFAGLVLCTVCGDMKKAECRKQKCKAAKAAPAGPVAVVDSSSSESDGEESESASDAE